MNLENTAPVRAARPDTAFERLVMREHGDNPPSRGKAMPPAQSGRSRIVFQRGTCETRGAH